MSVRLAEDVGHLFVHSKGQPQGGHLEACAIVGAETSADAPADEVKTGNQQPEGVSGFE